MELTFAPSRNSKDLRKNETDILNDDLRPDLTDKDMKSVKFKTVKHEGKLQCLIITNIFLF